MSINLDIEKITANSKPFKLKFPKGFNIELLDFKIRFAGIIYDYRQDNNLNKNELGNITNLDEDAITDIESAESDISLSGLLDIALKLNIGHSVEISFSEDKNSELVKFVSEHLQKK